MDFRRVRPAELLALASGMLLLIDMFLPWYSFAAGRLDAWDSLSVTLVPLAIAAVTAIYLFSITLTHDSPALPVAAAIWTTVLGLIASIFALVRVLALPGGAIDRCYGCWVGLGTTLLIFASGWWALRDERPWRGVPATTPTPGSR